MLFLLVSSFGMIIAMQKGPEQLLELIRQRADISHINTEKLRYIKNQYGENVLHLACKQGDYVSAEKMCYGRTKEDIHNLRFARDHKGYLWIHKAAETNQEFVTTTLLIKYLKKSGNIEELITDRYNSNNDSPLHIAAKNENLTILKTFINSCTIDVLKELLFIRNHQRWTPLHYAIKNNHVEMIEFILETASDVENKLAARL